MNPPLPPLPPPLPEPLSPAIPSWQRALGGIWRLTYPRCLAPTNLGILAGLLGLFALLVLTSVHEGKSGNFVSLSVNFYLALIVPTFAFLAAAGLIQEDLKPATTDYVLTRPVRRHTFVLHRYLAHTACLQGQCLLALALLGAVGQFRHIPNLGTLMSWFLLAQLFAVMAFSALGFAFGALTSRYLVLGIVYAVIIEIGIGQIPTQLNRLTMTHHVRVIANHGQQWFGSLGALLVFSLALLAIAAALFSFRESTGAKPQDT